MKKHARIITIVIVSLLIISFTIVGDMKIKIADKDTNVLNQSGVKDNSIEAINPKVEAEGNSIEANSQSSNNNDKSVKLLEKERMSKGGVIGTAGKGVVALRFDDYQNIFGEKIYPLLEARGLPSSMVLISRFSTSHKWSIGTT
ncbi:hypothetical protein [uncultured Clostridium sp.]|uniref:hypothetical protein n=1 Tax=uncultured Clostridium sp. TaxID=59620 RepID=UPI00321627D2